MIAFRLEFLDALRNEGSGSQLVELVLRYKSRGLSQRDAYDALESIWKDIRTGADEESAMCERLEAVMDRVWGYCGKNDAIWETSLSRVEG